MARLKFDGDATGLVAAQRKVRNESKQMDDQFQAVLETNKKLEAQVKRTWEQARTPLERYNDKVRRLNDLRKQNRITEDQYKAALDATTKAYRRLEREQSGTFGARASRQINQYLGQLDAVSMAVGTVQQAFADLDQFQETQADRERQRIKELVKLYTLPGTAEDRAGFVRQALELEAGGVQGGPGTSIFAAESAVMNTAENRRLIQDLKNLPGFFDDPDQTIADAGKLITNFPDVQQLNEALGKLQAISGVSQADVTSIGRAAPTFAGLAAEQGIMSDEALAALSVLSDALKTPDSAAEAFKGLVTEFKRGSDQFDITGRTLDERLQKIQMVLDQGQAGVNDIFSTDTARVAATFLLRDREQFLQRAGVSAVAPGIRDTMQQVLEDPNLGPTLEAERRRRISEFRGREEGRQRVQSEAALQDAVSQARERSPGAITGFAARTAGEFAQRAGGSESIVAGFARAGEFAQEFNPIAQAESGISRMIQVLSQIRDNTSRGPARATRPEN